MPADPPTPTDFNPADYRILAVNDDTANLMLTKLLLNRAGYQVEIANGGPEGLAMLENQRFDLAIVDTMMPVMDGFEVVQLIRRDNRFDGMLIIVLGYGEEQHENELAIESGADGYLNGPLVYRVLVASVRDILLKGRTSDRGQ